MKTNKGFTLTEVLVSLVIVGILGTVVLNLYAYKVKIDNKTKRNIDISNQVTTIFNNFSASPETFDIIYHNNLVTETTYIYKIPMNKSAKSYYLVEYNKPTETIPYFIINLTIYYNEEIIQINDQNSLKRMIYAGV